MGKHRDSLPGGRNSNRKEGGGGTPQNGSTFMDHQLCHTPGGRYGYRKEWRQEQAIKRQDARDLRTPTQQLALLDARLGEGVGAEKERARLHALIKENNAEKGTA